MSTFTPFPLKAIDRLLPYDSDLGIPALCYAENSFVPDDYERRLPPPLRHWVNLASEGPDRDAVLLVMWVVSTPNALMRPVGC